MPVLERQIQQNNVVWATRTYRGKLVVRKYSQGGARFKGGDPDVVFWPKRPGVPFLIEYKRTGEKPTPRQEARIKEYRALGYHVYVVDNAEEGRAIISREMEVV